MYIPNIPDNSLKNEIAQIVKIAAALEGMEHFAFYPPASEQELQELEDYFDTAFPESYKDWMRFSNGAEIAGNYVTIFRTSEITGYQIGHIPDDYIIIGRLIGDGELLCISRTSGQFIRCFEGEEKYFDTLNDFFKRPLRRMLLNAEEMTGEAMISARTFALQPLRIPAGWGVTYNMFSEYDPERDSPEYSYELCEDLLQLEHRNLLIDLGWYPHGDPEGSYTLYLVDTTQEFPFDAPLELFRSRSKQEIIYRIEYWTNSGFFSKYLH